MRGPANIRILAVARLTGLILGCCRELRFWRMRILRRMSIHEFRKGRRTKISGIGLMHVLIMANRCM